MSRKQHQNNHQPAEWIECHVCNGTGESPWSQIVDPCPDCRGHGGAYVLQTESVLEDAEL
jgi:DnaJ-class molecular chaperone